MSDSQGPATPEGDLPDGSLPGGATPTEDAPTEFISRRALRESRSGRRAKPAAEEPVEQPAEPLTVSTEGVFADVDAQPAGQVPPSATPPSAPPPSAPPSAPRGERASGGIAALIRRHPRAWLGGALGAAFLLLAAGAVAAGAATAPRPTVAAPEPTPTVEPRTVPAALPAPTPVRTCSVAGILADPRLTAFSGQVVSAATGEVLLDRSGAQPQRTGSVLKTLTAAAALEALGPDTQLSTQVLDGTSPGVIVLRGGGDPTLATTSATVYSGAPLIGDLARAAVTRYNEVHPGVPITQIVLDSTMWNPDDRWDDSWLRSEQSMGYQAETTALMVDGGRADPSSTVSPRSSDPIGDAGRAFRDAAGLTGVTITTGSAPAGGVLAEVKSQPVSVLIGQMMSWSDNILAENLARAVSVSMGLGGSSASLNQAIPSALSTYGLDTSNLTIRDGSGLSEFNAVPASFITALMSKARTGEQNLGIMFNALPVSGLSGTLASRFTGDNAIAVGAVVAKTGWIDTAYTLGGVVNAADGTPLAFMFASVRDGITPDAKDAQDTLATGLYSCGNNLSNN
ncbi:D-alanyl-D-alanine carboxypeptidase/D-alanyl-D-alanine-endopeptidase (penicillin-binding protein 4) [Microbacteriaceae bacterium SG_E_30_P1]|uniref:D-alanyl-D-alanine carboxypeptidase/D-alanyl-D-alanine-endopeptidase (Penicillin-binding protein 4) n=1 Tax=Antiquaquibacter oligotrophicus TaxID=2880260 RepID=A0ABT6KP76_9MICO|nr:D-alanyl-D-alanine carboxypeptidase/D-alanyl-D-alanine-endopeptidase [Antiquaquibacter oligotrophicus]MDH6181799.1 D-alanyl-D-alanine carboxypeptidase/D-alanyl-D-alanine-endopeptidase (penicillin-binding protein 4) [Antiquaquibacter oligotrophicus]UDF12521.1 D-alanyl-D-alanine carboxypeptidase/D-alanyl-D-alanine-endopeptidase [Antiquaquibacter oligotrophicus]